MSCTAARVIVAALCLAAPPLWAAAAQAGPPGSPGYCPGDGLVHDWDTGKPFGSCPIGGGFVSTPRGNIWVGGNGQVFQAPTAQGQNRNVGPYPDSPAPDGDGRPNLRPHAVQPGAPDPQEPGNAGAVGGPP